MWFKYGSFSVELFRSFPKLESAIKCALETLKNIFLVASDVILRHLKKLFDIWSATLERP